MPLVVTLLLLSALAVPAAGETGPGLASLAEAVTYYEAGAYVKSLTLLERALRDFPSGEKALRGTAYFMQARCHYMLQEEADFSRAARQAKQIGYEPDAASLPSGFLEVYETAVGSTVDRGKKDKDVVSPTPSAPPRGRSSRSTRSTKVRGALTFGMSVSSWSNLEEISPTVAGGGGMRISVRPPARAVRFDTDIFYMVKGYEQDFQSSGTDYTSTLRQHYLVISPMVHLGTAAYLIVGAEFSTLLKAKSTLSGPDGSIGDGTEVTDYLKTFDPGLAIGIGFGQRHFFEMRWVMGMSGTLKEPGSTIEPQNRSLYLMFGLVI